MKKLVFTLVVVCFTISSILAQSIVQESSKVTFEVSNMGFRTVEGTFEGMKGALIFDASDLDNASFDVCIDAATIDTDNEKRDKHLKNEDFFDVEKYPTICFKSNKVEKTTGGYVAKGALTLHGVTKPVELPFTYNEKTFKGDLKVKRFEYGVGGKGGFMVGKEVSLVIECKVQ